MAIGNWGNVTWWSLGELWRTESACSAVDRMGGAIVIIRKCWPQHHSYHHTARCEDSWCNPIHANVNHIDLYEHQQFYFLKYCCQKMPTSASLPSIMAPPDARTLGAIQRKQELICYEYILQLIKPGTLKNEAKQGSPYHIWKLFRVVLMILYSGDTHGICVLVSMEFIDINPRCAIKQW